MFDSLEEQIKSDEHKATNARERAVKWTIGTVVMVLILVGLYVGFNLLNGT